jgi:uncharacterized membrane protein YjjP (DUF1212 family)/uncharacterized membrane protein YjjB (DUF3815 family)
MRQEIEHTVTASQPIDAATSPSELLVCLRAIGQALMASGNPVSLVEDTLTEIAARYGVTCETAVLPNILIIRLGENTSAVLDVTTQRLTTLRLDQMSDLAVLIDRVKQRRLTPAEAARRVDHIRATAPRFGLAPTVAGYVLLVFGLTLRMRPAWDALFVSSALGLLVGLMLVWFRWFPRFALLLPVLAALLVSALTFYLTRLGWIVGPANLIIPPLVTFLPGVTMTIGMMELASGHLMSGSSRLIYGGTSLFLLFFGIALGVTIAQLPSSLVYEYSPVIFPWWAPILGTLLYGVGLFVFLSGANRDLPWMLLVLFVAMLGQDLGERYLGSYLGTFLGALLLGLCADVIARLPQGTPAMASWVPGFWFLVPGSRGVLSFTNLLGENYLESLVAFGQMIALLVAISLGILLATLLMAPRRYERTEL